MRTRMIAVYLLVFLSLLAVSRPVSAAVIPFPDIVLSSANSHAPGNDSDGIGTVTAVYNDQTNEICFTTSWTLDTTSTMVTVAHFHGPATPEQDAGVQIGLTGISTAVTGSHSQVSALNDTQEADLLA